MLLSEELLRECERRFESLKEPRSTLKGNRSFDNDQAMEVSNISPDRTEKTGNRKMTLEYKAPEPTDFAYERAIGKNDSVYSNFVELIMNAKEKIGRILVKKNHSLVGYATGFMVSPRLMLTNWHVFNTAFDAQTSEVQFGYEFDVYGKEKAVTAFSFVPDEFFYSNKELDYCLVAASPISKDSSVELSSFGYLYLDPEKGKLREERKECLNIIHHPDGDFKQLSIRQNLFTKITPTTIWYEADTAQGSSGGPVLNDQWQVVALHHSGVADKNEKGEYIDKYGNPVPYIGDRIQESKINWISNEGIRISLILEDIFTVYPKHELVVQLKLKNDTARVSAPAIRSSEMEDNSLIPTSYTKALQPGSSDIRIALPGNLLESVSSINLKISQTKQWSVLHHSLAKKLMSFRSLRLKSWNRAWTIRTVGVTSPIFLALKFHCRNLTRNSKSLSLIQTAANPQSSNTTIIAYVTTRYAKRLRSVP